MKTNLRQRHTFVGENRNFVLRNESFLLTEDKGVAGEFFWGEVIGLILMQLFGFNKRRSKSGSILIVFF
jgi:hypothetical protein